MNLISQCPMLGTLVATLLAAHVCAQGYAPREAVDKMSVADGLAVDLIAAESLVRQPVAIDFDDRGRLWVLQYLQYPNPAGLSRVKVDRYSRTTYDRVPEPPPRGPRGADRLTILTDTDGDGLCDQAQDFVNGLNLSTGFAFGHGGVFVLQVPYLLFYPDRDGDDVPDSDPEVRLTGFGMEDSSSLANSLIWGPDGWLYGTQGTNITARIRGIEFEQGVWRYEPVTDRFELFCEGGGNSWGLDFDASGNLLYATNHGGYLMHHGMQGSYHEKAFAKHGELHNRFAFGYFPHVPHDRFEGGHVTVGGFVYQGAALPSSFRGRYLSVDTLGHAVRANDIEADGATFRTRNGASLVDANDTWFAPSDCVMGPDGAVYFSDWHDQRTAHPDPDAEWDRANGRVYRLRPKDWAPAIPIDPRTLPSGDLVTWLSKRNEWQVRRARRVLAERRDSNVVPELHRMLESLSGTAARQALWTLASMGQFQRDLPLALFTHPDEVVRAWAVRLWGDRSPGTESLSLTPGPVPDAIATQLVIAASTDESPLVVSQLAATAQRLPADVAIRVICAIGTRDKWLDDRYIPLLTWWALERHAMAARTDVLAVFGQPAIWENRFAREVLLGRLMRRFAGDGSPEGLQASAQLLSTTDDPIHKAQLMAELDEGLRMWGRHRAPGLPMGAAFNDIASIRMETREDAARPTMIPPELALQLDPLWDKQTRDPLLVRLFARLGRTSAEQRAIDIACDGNEAHETRQAMLSVLEELGTRICIDPLLQVVRQDPSATMRQAALSVLRRFSDERITRQLLEMYPQLDDGLKATARDVLCARPGSALVFLRQVDLGRVSTDDVSAIELRRLALHEDDRINTIVRKYWGTIRSGTPEDKLAEIRRITNDLRAGSGDLNSGRQLFTKQCATCHRLFDDGNHIGPDLTSANRTDLFFLLASLVDPSAQIRKEYLQYHVLTDDGRLAAGLLIEDDAEHVTLLTEKNERVVLDRDEVEQIEVSPLSLMPENLLQQLKPQELRDLFAYLQSQTK